MSFQSPKSDLIYLDYAASTPPDHRVLESFLTASLRFVGNPHSAEHTLGSQAGRMVSESGKEIASLLGLDHHRTVFTSGATEASNLVFSGVAEQLLKSGKTHILISALEHASVRAAAHRWLADSRFEIEEIPACRDGKICAKDIGPLLRADTGLIAVMAVNNEIGTIQPIEEIARISAAAGVLFLCDASQALGRLDLSTLRVTPDLVVVSGHKAYCPAGIGALFIGPMVPELAPMQVGGSQQGGFRAGTVPTALVACFKEGVKIAVAERESDWNHAFQCAAVFERTLRRFGVPFVPHGLRATRVPHILNLALSGIDSSELLSLVPTVCFSRGAACSSAKGALSKTLLALGANEPEIRSSARFSFGRSLKVRDVERAASEVASGYLALKGIVPPVAEHDGSADLGQPRIALKPASNKIFAGGN